MKSKEEALHRRKEHLDTMERRNFLKTAGAAAGLGEVPGLARPSFGPISGPGTRPVCGRVAGVFVGVIGIERGLIARWQGLGNGLIQTVGRRLVVPVVSVATLTLYKLDGAGVTCRGARGTPAVMPPAPSI